MNDSVLLTRSSTKVILMPGLRNASSRRRLASNSNLKSLVVKKISGSGENAILVPVLFVSPITFNLAVVFPRENSILWTLLSRRTSTSNHSETALTHFAPTPCRPPET